MAQFKEIMALRLDNRSYSYIAAALGCSNRDIAKVQAVIDDHDITPDSFTQLPPAFFDETFTDQRSRRSKAYDLPAFKALAGKLAADKHLTRHKLWMDYLATPSADGLLKYQYSQFCDGLAEYLKANELVDVVEHEPGQEFYVDWAGDKITIYDQATGRVGFKASLFIGVCPYSGLMFAVAAANEKMSAWIDCHVKALNYLGKLPAVIVPDNASTATYRPKKNSSYRAITSRYADFADYYDITVVPTRPAKPRDKAAVERAVQIAYTRILGYFHGEQFYTLDELNDAIAERLADINDVMTRPDGSTRRQRFNEDEAPMMRDLPDMAFTEVSWRSVKVDRNWHISCDYQYYSVPFQLVGKTLRARLTTDLVSIFNGDRLVAEHTRMHGFRYRYSTDSTHGPSGDHEAHNVLTRDELLAWAGSFGPATTTVITRILDRNRASVPRGLTLSRNILANLGRKHDKTTLEPACAQLVDKQLTPTMSVLKRIQADIAHARPTTTTQPTPGSPRQVDLSRLSDSVFIRPASHFDTDQEGK